MNTPLFLAAYPYRDDVLDLPVEDLDIAAAWYSKTFGMSEVVRTDTPLANVILERDGVRVGFSINGGDASQDGAAILVSDIHQAKAGLESQGVEVKNLQTEERDGQKYIAFFVVAPDGLCYYFHQLDSNSDE